MANLILTYEDLTLTLREWISPGGYSRKPQPSGDVEYSLYGAPIDDGPVYEAKFLWTLNCLTSAAQWRTLQRMFRRSELNRGLAQPYAVTVADYIDPYCEDGPARTRAIAPGGLVLNEADGGISYPALYNARIFEPGAQKAGIYYQVSLTLKELESVAP